VERLVANGDERAAGRLCVAAVTMGPAQAEAVRQLAVQLLAADSTHTAAAVTAAFWQEAAAADAISRASSINALQPELAGEAAAADLPAEPAAAAAGPPASTRLPIAEGMASLGVAESGSLPPPATLPAALAPTPAEATVTATASPKAKAEEAVAGAAPGAPAAAAATGKPAPAELQRATALVLAAAIVEAVQLGHEVAVMDVTEELLSAGHQELISALVASMVEAGHIGEVGKLSVAALAAGRTRVVTELSGG
jgi:hypothetical protein